MLSESGVVKSSDFGFKERCNAQYVYEGSMSDALMYLALEVFEDGAKLKKTIVGRASGVKECDGAEVFNSIEMVLLCMMVSG